MRFYEALVDEFTKVAEETDKERRKRLKSNYGRLGSSIGLLGGSVSGALKGKSTTGMLARGAVGGALGSAGGYLLGRRVGGKLARMAERREGGHRDQRKRSIFNKNYSLEKEK